MSVLFYKAKRQYLPTCKVDRYCLLDSHIQLYLFFLESDKFEGEIIINSYSAAIDFRRHTEVRLWRLQSIPAL